MLSEFWRSIKWRMGTRQRQITSLQRHIQIIKGVLEEKRIALFLQLVPYRRGMSLDDDRPKSISLEDLERRIAILEKAHEH